MRLSTDDLGMFFAEEHAAIADEARAIAAKLREDEAAGVDDRAIVARIAPLFRYCVGGGVGSRALCVIREALAYESARADSIFAVQGLGTHVVGGELEAYRRGDNIAAFALTEPEAGSDVAAIATTATQAGEAWELSGEKIFISNIGIADHALVVARTGEKLSAFWVDLAQPGIEQIAMEATAPHPIGRIVLRGAKGTLVGQVGQGMRLALTTLDAFRVSVGAAAVGMARRALDEALAFVSARVQFGKPLAEQPLVQAHLADMLVDLDAARLLVLRAAHAKDTAGGPQTLHVSVAKLGATEAAQRVIDRAVQLFGGRGVMHGAVVEHLYRAIRPLRIYEGTSEIQRTIIGRALTARGK